MRRAAGDRPRLPRSHAAIALRITVALPTAAGADPPPATGPAPDAPIAPDLPSHRRERAATLALRYRRATSFDGGTIELAVRRPLANRWWADAAIGLQLGIASDRRAITLTNPRLGLGLVVRPRLIATVELGLPAASASGDDGAFAAAHAALAPVDPSALGPRTASLAVTVSPRWIAGKAFAQVALGITQLIPADLPNRTLLRADLGGGIVVAGPVHLAATFATTAEVQGPGAGATFVHRLALAAQIDTRHAELTAGVAAPLDRRERDRDLVELFLTARARF